MLYICILPSFLIGFVVGFFILKSKNSVLNFENNNLKNQKQEEQKQLTDMQNAYKNISENYIKLKSDFDNKSLASNKLEAEKNEIIHQLENAKSRIIELERFYAGYKAKYEAELTKYEELKIAFEKNVEEKSKNLQRQMEEKFELITKQNIEQTRKISLEENEKSISTILNPLKEDIQNFKKRIEEVNTEDAARTQLIKTSIEKEIEAMKNSTNEISKQANNLTNALKQKNKTQGNWGEMIFENLLESVGMKRDIDYYREENISSEDGSNQRPDFIIKLPNNDALIVDCKVSLINYEQYVNAQNEEERAAASKLLFESVKSHIKNLSSKRYHKGVTKRKDINFLETIVMFIPIEGVYYEIQKDAKLIEDAWKEQIIPLGSYNLMPMLKSIVGLSQLEKRGKNADEIWDLTYKMYDKIIAICADISSIENRTYGILKDIASISTKQKGSGGVEVLQNKMKSIGLSSAKELKLVSTTVDGILLQQKNKEEELFKLEKKEE